MGHNFLLLCHYHSKRHRRINVLWSHLISTIWYHKPSYITHKEIVSWWHQDQKGNLGVGFSVFISLCCNETSLPLCSSSLCLADLYPQLLLQCSLASLVRQYCTWLEDSVLLTPYWFWSQHGITKQFSRRDKETTWWFFTLFSLWYENHVTNFQTI